MSNISLIIFGAIIFFCGYHFCKQIKDQHMHYVVIILFLILTGGGVTKKDDVINFVSNSVSAKTIDSNIKDIKIDSDLGNLSKKYESNGNIATIGNIIGDHGGKSYGVYQIASGTGTLNHFKSWLKVKDQNIYNRLCNTNNFDNAWVTLSKQEPQKFFKLQHDFIAETHYMPVIEAMPILNKRSKALREVIFSLSIQHGSGGAINLLKNIDINSGDREVIEQIYAERSKVNIYFTSQTATTKQALINRFKNEKNDALNLLKQEG